MELKKWLEHHTQASLAKSLGVTQGAVSHWVSGKKKVDPLRVLEVERVTKGAVTRYELRPDIYPIE